MFKHEQLRKWWHLEQQLLGTLLFLMIAIGYGASYAFAPWLAAQRMRKLDPRLSLVPIDLPTKTEEHLSTRTIDRYGYRVQLPNEEIAKTDQDDLITVVSFSNGGNLMIDNPSDAGLFTAISDKDSERSARQEQFQSKFKLVQAAMSATPDQVKWWRFRNAENERVKYLLLIKFSVLTASRHSATLGPIYPISAGAFRGFQIGDPSVSPYQAHLDLFDGTDTHFEFDVNGPEGHAQVLTQAEINAMVASIRPISAP